MSAHTITSNASSKPIFNWASVAKGKPQTTTEFEAEKFALAEKQRLAKEVERQAQWLCDAPRKERIENMRLAQLSREQEQAQRVAAEQAKYARLETKEYGYLETWPRASEAYDLPKLMVPKNINERARDWIEQALAAWWPEWEKCATVDALREAFINAFVPYIFHHSYLRGMDVYEKWERSMMHARPLASGEVYPNAERYTYITQWVAEMEADKVHPPYGNKFWVACKNITFANCLAAMTDNSQAFCVQKKKVQGDTEDDVGNASGFLRLDSSQAITWLADFQNYIPRKHAPKEKCRQWKEAQAERERREEAAKDLFDDDD